MSKQHIMNELDKRCGVFRSSYKLVDQAILQERDELIGFAKAVVLSRAVASKGRS